MRDENNKLDDKAEYTLGDVKRKAEKQTRAIVAAVWCAAGATATSRCCIDMAIVAQRAAAAAAGDEDDADRLMLSICAARRRLS